jgi:hypothetical protein
MKKYEIISPIKGKAENMLKCPKGCIRGRCKKSSDGCKNDIDCQYCKDTSTNMFYVNMDNERRILPILEEQKYLNLTQTDMLNNYIKDNNNYIKEMNEKIVKKNIRV